ncbi:Predicted Zn-dependent peptidase [Pilibacter termitis]|uniref:Predicted Zn-dependent peptidase n=1 Tax=Pilibacter termitis TaxID=263852 RepID=A0A1T4M4R8_9ENTE|nr:pitrilysin family protein [Pilibacter termitis]SJZ61734.1 Predicted Zn-dependent peptidase [Pilibacter termitis]
MESKSYKKINEVLFVEKFENGLQVYFLPKRDFHKVYAVFTTNYGSIDNEFVPLTSTEMERVPDGIAHFLEHKLFEKEDGDVFQKFSMQGASSNAFTTFSKTSYLFHATSNVYENLKLLLDFVQTPYFTKESVDKEKGIIAQEIQMYQDDANWRLFFGLLQNLYPETSISIDIAGTVASIQEITADDLYKCYETFYHPSNMTLFVVGNFDENEMLHFIRENQAEKSFIQQKEILRSEINETSEVLSHREIEMEVVRPKFIFGQKGVDNLPECERELLKYKLSISAIGQLLFSHSSEHYLHLYEAGIIDDTFDEEFSLDRGFHFFSVSGDSENYHKAIQEVQRIFEHFDESPEFTEEKLALLKKRMLGKYFQSLNSLEFIANQFSQSLFGEITLFDLPEVIEELTLADVEKYGKAFLNPEYFTSFVILPRGDRK